MASKKITRICETCGRVFQRYISQVTRRGGKYCSSECYHAPKNPTPEKFWANVNKTGNCWLWTAGCSDNGYGAFYWYGKQTGAHRVAFELSSGPIPQDALILHHCDNPPCVNPSHLFAGTPQDNMTDKTLKGRIPRGATHYTVIGKKQSHSKPLIGSGDPAMGQGRRSVK